MLLLVVTFLTGCGLFQQRVASTPTFTGLDCTPAVMPAPGSDGDVFVVNRCVINDWLAARRALRGTAPELKDSPK